MKKTATLTLIAALTLTFLSACATSTPSELESARATLDQAKTLNADVYAPVAYENAEHALKHAESTFDDEGDDAETRADAYVAHRKALSAIAISDRVQTEARADNKTDDLMASLQDAMGDMALVKRPTPQRIIVSLQGAVLFEYNKAKLMEISERKLNNVAAALNARPGFTITVEGHTDAIGTEAYNNELSRDRAAAVRDYLITQGVASNRIMLKAQGETEPVASNATPEGRANNRRVELVISRNPMARR